MKLNKFLLLTIIFALCSCREAIMHNLGEMEANKMLASLVSSNIEARKEKQTDGKWSLPVPTDQAALAIKFLSEKRLLKEDNNPLPDKAGLLISREEQRFRYERGLSREIEATLSGIPGILQARVHLNLPIVDPLFGQTLDSSKSSASVLLVVSEQPIEKSDIANLVAGASGIPATSVAVMLSKSVEEVQNTNLPLVALAAVTEKPQLTEPLVNEQKIVSTQEQIQNISTKPGWFQKFRYYLGQISWKIIGIFVGLSMIIIGIIRLINKPSRVVM